VFQIDKCVIDLNFDDDVMRLEYPMESPVPFTLGEKFLQEKLIFNFIIMTELGNKYKKIAKGDVELQSKYFLEKKTIFEKWIYITPFKSQIEEFGLKGDLLKNEINNGKINVKIELQENPEEYKTKLLLYQKDNQNANNNDINNNNRKNFNFNLKDGENNRNIQFDDNLSDVSISILDVKEEDRKGLDIEQLIDDDYIENLKQIIENNYQKILPKDPAKLKQINESLYKKFINLSNTYNEVLYSLATTGEEIREETKKFYDDYKLLKKDIYNGRVDLKKQNYQLKREIEANNQENKTLKQEIENYKTEKKILKNKLGLEDTKKTENPDIEILSETLKKLNDMGIDIFVGSGLSEDDKNLVKNMLNINTNDDENKKDLGTDNEYEGEDDIKEDLELGNQIVALIEKDVNDLYLRKKIEQVKIDQINAITYVFQNDKDTHEVTLKIIKDELYCSDGTTFSSWLIKNFSA
jgi:soluble P-type ATPase